MVDRFGRLIQRLGTTEPLYEGTFARNYEDAPTETPSAGAIEVWRIFNTTGDTHPIHSNGQRFPGPYKTRPGRALVIAPFSNAI